MTILEQLRDRFRHALQKICSETEEWTRAIAPAQDPKFGDYQANFAMPLARQLGKPPREVAQQVVSALDVSDICFPPEIAGPGFINLRLREEWIGQELLRALLDERLGFAKSSQPKKYVIDFSSPNVAKPMHVGHIRSTVIGDALTKMLRFAGHHVVTDNHLGDWGTQFGMIIFGYKHLVDRQAYLSDPVAELSSLYRRVRLVMDYQASLPQRPKWEEALRERAQRLAELKAKRAATAAQDQKSLQKELDDLIVAHRELEETIEQAREVAARVEQDPKLAALAARFPDVERAVLAETAKLHAGDEESLQLWKEFLPACRADIQRLYRRLKVEFDYELGESFYHDRLESVVADLRRRGLAEESDGAVCVFLDGFETPMIIQKRDGAFLYSTTDLATIAYRMETWNPDAILYVVDHRQHEHFEKLFAAARRWGYDQVELRHIAFGTVLGDDGRPFKTRSGETVGLEMLLDEAERRAREVLQQVSEEREAPMSDAQQAQVSQVVGLGALKYADLSQNRQTDYKFSFDKMLELKGNTATYLQYLFARVQGIYRKAGLDEAAVRAGPVPFELTTDVERQLALELLRWGEALNDVLVDYRPNILAQYLFNLAQTFFKFYNQCSVLQAETESLRKSRLQLCNLTGRVVQQGLALLGIDVVDQM